MAKALNANAYTDMKDEADASNNATPDGSIAAADQSAFVSLSLSGGSVSSIGNFTSGGIGEPVVGTDGTDEPNTGAIFGGAPVVPAAVVQPPANDGDGLIALFGGGTGGTTGTPAPANGQVQDGNGNIAGGGTTSSPAPTNGQIQDGTGGGQIFNSGGSTGQDGNLAGGTTGDTNGAIAGASDGVTSSSSTLGPEDVTTYAIGEQYTGDPIPNAETAATSLINWDTFRSDPLFAGINGSGVTVAVLDTGADLNHPFFGADANNDGVADRIVYQYDFINGDNNAEDGNGHGSNVAGIVGSQNATYSGMAPGVNLVVLKVLDDAGSGTGTALQQALQWVEANAAAYNIVSVNMSLGFGVNDASAHNWFLTTDLQNLYNQGVAVVSAAGNGYYSYQTQGVDYPGSDPYSWAVGAVYATSYGQLSYTSGAIDYTTGADRVTSFSQRSTTQTDIFAPGAIITNAGANGTTVGYTGTSQAAPHIAGIVALMQDLSLHISGHQLGVDTMRTLMRSSADTIYDGDDENDNVTNTNQNYLRVDVEAFANQVVQYWQTSTAGADTLYGWRGNDTILGQGGIDTIYGNDGNDTLEGGLGNDTIYGGANDDLVRGDDGDDFVYGGTGLDKLSGKNGNDTVYGEDGNDQLWGDNGNDTLEGGLGDDILRGGNDDDLMRGDAGNDTLYGGAGQDRLAGKDNDDLVYGEDGNDQLWGDNGNDTLVGGAGGDTMQGGAGNDTFVFAAGWGADVINAWQNGVDRMDFTALAGAGVHSAANLTTQVIAGNTVISYSGNQITLTGFTGSLNTSNWLFA